MLDKLSPMRRGIHDYHHRPAAPSPYPPYSRASSEWYAGRRAARFIQQFHHNQKGPNNAR